MTTPLSAKESWAHEVRKTLRTKTELGIVRLVLHVYDAAGHVPPDVVPLVVRFTNNLLRRLCERNGWSKVQSIGGSPDGKLFVTAIPRKKMMRRSK